MLPRWFTAVVMSGLLAAFSSSVHAQTDSATCTALAETALSSFYSSCANLEGYSACYGYPTLEASFKDDTYAGLFTRPGDRSPVGLLNSVHALPADPAASRWGIGLIKLDLSERPGAQANLLLLGEAYVTELSLLPTSEQPTRSLRFQAGAPASACAETPHALVVQAPDDIGIRLTINGTMMQISSLVVFQWSSKNSLAAVVYSGWLQIAGGQTASAGQTLLMVADNDGEVAFWSAPRPSTAAEISAATIGARALSGIGAPIAGAVVQPTAVPEAPAPLPPACASSVTHVVQPGENLYRIALRYGTSIDAIASASGVTDINHIVVGQTLTIPCGADTTASSPPPPADNPPAAPPAADAPASVDCSILSDPLAAGVPPDLLSWLRELCAG